MKKRTMEKEHQAEERRKKVLMEIAGAVVVLTVIVSIGLSHLGTDKVNTSAGVKAIKKLEKADVSEVETKISNIENGYTNYLFLGDSITEFYNLDNYYGDYKIVNSGVCGNQTDDILNDLKKRAYVYNPSTIFLLIGTNDLEHKKTVEDTQKNIKEIVNKLNKNLPNAKIYLESIYPVNDTDNKKVRNFSLGMRQRLGIAITLCSNPKFIILDEPINGLDPEGIIAIRKLILKLNKEQNITFLISSHYLDELSKIATNYGFIKNGKIIKEISSKEFNEKKQIKTELIVDVPKTAIKYFKLKNLQYKIIDNNTFELSNITNISNLILELSNLNCSVKNIKKTEETLENYYLDLIGGKEND